MSVLHNLDSKLGSRLVKVWWCKWEMVIRNNGENDGGGFFFFTSKSFYDVVPGRVTACGHLDRETLGSAL